MDGATDYVAMPFRFSDGQINVISMTSFRKGGFSTSHLGSIYESHAGAWPPVRGSCAAAHLGGLLETYLGRSTGKRVLEGQIKHGDGQLIHAVIWFCDLRNSTNLAASMDAATYLAHLNRFLGAMAGAIIDHGGEILAYIGDAVLAIFPIADERRALRRRGFTPAEACARAIEAARTAAQRIAAANSERPDMPALQYGIGLHVGDVTYGNIGIPQRLQFTVIGSAANEASRIEGMTKELGEPVLVSSRFAELYSGELVSKGSHALKGVAGTHELFALAPAPGLHPAGRADAETVRHRNAFAPHEASTMTDEDLDEASKRSATGDHATALSIYRRWAEQGDARAQDQLGILYESGTGVTKSYVEAVKWYRRAADQGYADAQNNLGVMYETGHGVPRDTIEAAKWYFKAAEQGDANAQHNLGNRFESGDGVPQNYAAADPVVSKGRRAAASDGAGQSRRHVRARSRYVGQDWVQAQMWFILSASFFRASEAKSRGLVIRNRDQLAAKMTPEQIAEARRLAREWRPSR